MGHIKRKNMNRKDISSNRIVNSYYKMKDAQLKVGSSSVMDMETYAENVLSTRARKGMRIDETFLFNNLTSDLEARYPKATGEEIDEVISTMLEKFL